jgi:Ca2+-binding RTX toxin-like protein
MSRLPLTIAGAITGIALWACSPALAASARVDTIQSPGGGTGLLLVYEAGAGESNDVTVGREPDGWYRVHDAGASIAPGSRCEPASGGDVRCFANFVEVRTGDMDDHVTAAAGSAVERVSGGDGDDTLELPADNPIRTARATGGDGDDVLRAGATDAALLEGGPGADELDGGSAADTFDGGTGSDRIAGGGGVDGLSNRGRLDGVTVDLAGGFTTGPGGERDELSGQIDNASGGAGPDVLLGNGRQNLIDGGPGDDTIRGAGGNDVLAGDAGRDDLYGDAGNDSLFAGSDFLPDSAPNSLSGGTGWDELVGGSWRDVFDGGPGSDWMLGQGGHDVYAARDGEFDWLDCGSRDRGQLTIDVRDFTRNCGRASRPRAARATVVFGQLQTKRYYVGLACPSDVPERCDGTYRLVFPGGGTSRDRFHMLRGESPDNYSWVTKLTPAERRAVARAPASKLALRVTTRNARGHTVTFDTPFPGPPVFDWPRYATGYDCNDCPPDP